MEAEMTSSFEDAATESEETLRPKISPEDNGGGGVARPELWLIGICFEATALETAGGLCWEWVASISFFNAVMYLFQMNRDIVLNFLQV
jgi:hypothetical protein